MTAAAGLALSLFTKDIDENLYMNTIRAKELTLTRTSAGAAHIDGTPTTMPDKLHIQIVEDGLKVLVKKRY
jgi:diacylglycerol kinase family enzyme